MNKGKLIVLEGVEGVGKTTQCKLLKKALEERGYDVVLLREPGGVPASEEIRKLILHSEFDLSPLTEVFLFSAARAEFIKLLSKYLNEGKIIICDRFIYSTVAYQGYGRGVNISLIEQINKAVIGNVKPDLALFLDLDPEKGFARKGGVDQTDRMEKSGKEFFNSVYKGFRRQVVEGYLKSINADASIEEIAEAILQEVLSVL